MDKVIVASKRQPHELFLLGVSIPLGISYLLVTIPTPESIASQVPLWVVKVWAAGFLLSGLTGIVGALIRDPEIGLEVERSALYLSTFSLFFFAGAVVTYSTRLSFGLAIMAAWMGANIWRTLQIHKDLKALVAEVGAERGD